MGCPARGGLRFYTTCLTAGVIYGKTAVGSIYVAVCAFYNTCLTAGVICRKTAVGFVYVAVYI